MLVRRLWPSMPTFQRPFAEFEQLRREMMRRLLEGVADDTVGEAGAGVFPPMNVTQDDDNFYVRAEVPGLTANELSISALRNRLSISGRREIPGEQDRVSYHRKERAEGSFDRTLALPLEVDSERVDAHYADGILTVTLPKAPAAKPRQITVKI